MKYIKYVIPVLVLFQIAVFAQSLKKTSVLSYDSSMCKTIGRNPMITVCLDQATGKARVSKRLARAVRKAIRDLVKENKEADLDSSQETLSNFVGIAEYGVDCSGIACTSPVDWHSYCCGADTFCDAVPGDPLCI